MDIIEAYKKLPSQGNSLKKSRAKLLETETFAGMLYYANPTSSNVDFAKVWLDKLIKIGFLDIYKDVWDEFLERDWITIGANLNWKNEKGRRAQAACDSFLSATATVQYLTKEFPSFCENLWNGLVLCKIVDLLRTHTCHQAANLRKIPPQPGVELYLQTIIFYLHIIKNTLKHCPQRIPEFRGIHGFEAVAQYFNDSQIKKADTGLLRQIYCQSAFILSKTLTETREYELRIGGQLLTFFCSEILPEALDQKSRKMDGISVSESLEILNRLVSLDSVRMKLAKDDGNLSLLWSIFKNPKIPKDDEELAFLAQTFFILSFGVKAKQRLQKVVPQLKKELEKMENHANVNVKNAVQGVLWNVFGKIPVRIDSFAQHKLAVKHDAMIVHSYVEEAVPKFLNQALKDSGVKTWFAPEQMFGSSLAVAVEAIQSCNIIVACVSDVFRHDPLCQKELDYADSLRKPIISVNMQHGYEPDGWLSVILSKQRVKLKCYSPEMVFNLIVKLRKEFSVQPGPAMEAINGPGNITNKVTQNGHLARLQPREFEFGDVSLSKTAPSSLASSVSQSNRVKPKFKPKRSYSDNSLSKNRVLEDTIRNNKLEAMKSWNQSQVAEFFASKGLEEVYMEKMTTINSGDMLYQLIQIYKRSPKFFSAEMKKLGVTETHEILLLTLAFDEVVR